MSALFGRRSASQTVLSRGLTKTRTGLLGRIGQLFSGKRPLDAELIEELEEVLLTADVGMATTAKLLDRLEDRAKRKKEDLDADQIRVLLQDEIVNLFDNQSPSEPPSQARPHVILIVGVNGVGKTTTIGKLAHRFAGEGKKVVLGAADTFRAAAVDQLGLWAERTGATLVSKGMNADPSAVAFEAVAEGVKLGADVVIVDTAGRLHTKANLMEELSKVRRVIGKVMPDAPHEVLLVLDGSTGQNAIVQAEQFSRATQVTGLIITKLDGTAKGGVVISVVDQLGIPVRFIGLGEKADDLQPFERNQFAEALFAST